jgi:glycosyltransferase involved in cell wall biosynthesis/SAM-dependent methyltransferase
MADRKRSFRAPAQPGLQVTYDGFYRAFEDRFRGSRETIRSRLQIYLPFIEPLKSIYDVPPAVDLGCGRGEWLELLADNGFDAQGVDIDEGMLAACHENGLRATNDDGIAFLEKLPSESQMIVSGFHIAEHLPFGQLQILVQQALRVLKPGGLLILETPNPENFRVSSLSFYYDPTHRHPLPPQLLSFLPEYYGFDRVKVVRLQECRGLSTSESASLDQVLGGASPDYAVIGQKAADGSAARLFDSAFNKEFGLSADVLVGRFDRQLIARNERVAALEARFDEQRTARSALETRLDEERTARSALEARADEERTARSALEARADEERTARSALEARADEERTARSALEARFDEERSARSALEARFDEERIARAALAARLDEERTARAALVADLLPKNEALAALYASTSWRITEPLRDTRRATRWFAHGTRAWLTLKPGSRPKRIAARGVVLAARFCRARPPLANVARRALRWFPTIEARLRGIVAFNVVGPGAAPATGLDDVLFCEPSDVRLAYQRLRAAKANLGHALPSAVRVDGRPRLAYVSPLPPERTGVADYSAELLPALSAYYDIDAIVAPDPRSVPPIEGCLAIRDIAWFERHAHVYDRIVYHVGNSTFHHHMFPLLEKFPGMVVLHDFYLGHLLGFLETEGRWHGYWTRALCHAHGYEAVRRRFQQTEHNNVVRDYPVNLFVLQQAQGVIVHSEFSHALTRRFYGEAFSDKLTIIPHMRNLPTNVDRKTSRANLGIGEDEFLVCSFGILWENKLNHRVVEAWLASRLNEKRRSHLVFVGEAHSDAYLNKLRTAMWQSLGRTSIRITGYALPHLYRQYLAAADVAVQLRCQSRGESSGTVLDCMAHGLPLVVNAHGWMAELPDDSAIKLADNFVQADLVAALEHLEAEPAVRAALGQRAQNLIAKEFTPARIADQYRDAVEIFAKSAPPLFDTKALFRIAGDLPPDCLPMARSLAKTTALLQPARQLLVDISAMVREDLMSGIQRVVRAQLLVLLNSPPDGLRIEPVWLCEAGGCWHLRYARRYMLKLLGINRGDLDDEPVAVAKDDVYYMPDYFNDGVVRAAESGVYANLRDRGVRINFLIHDNLPVSKPQYFPEGTEKVHAAWLRSIAASADQLICISRDVAEDTGHWLEQNAPTLLHCPKLAVLHHGADIDASSATKGMPEDAPTVLEVLASRPTFLMVGTIEPRKGYLQTLDAFDELWAAGVAVNLVIVGAEGWKSAPGNRRTIPQIVARLREHPERKRRLFWLNGVSDEYLNKVYAASACLIAASEGEGFGLPLIEAAKHQLPILARDIPVFREVAGEHAAYFSGMQRGDLATAIRNWLVLYAEGRHPKSDDMPWITWAANVQLLKAILL